MLHNQYSPPSHQTSAVPTTLTTSFLLHSYKQPPASFPHPNTTTIMAQATLSLPWKTKLAVSLISFFSDAARRSDLTMNRRILSLVDFRAPPSTSHSVTSSDVTVDPSRRLWFRLYKPATSIDSNSCCGTNQCNDVGNEERGLLPVIVFFHGGGFAYLSADARAYDVVCRRFCKRINAIVISVNYRLAPEHKFPSQYDDGFDVLKFLKDNHSTILPSNANVTKIFLAGDSAGANLAHHVAVRLSGDSLVPVRVIGLISIQPFFGGENRTKSEETLVGVPLISVERTDWSWKAFMREDMNRDHYAVNVSGPNAENILDVEYPDTVVFVGGFDPLKDWQKKYYDWLRISGKNATLIEYPNMFHAFYIFPELPESGQLIQQVKDFVDRTAQNS